MDLSFVWMKYATKFASEWFDVNNMDQLTTFENNIKKQTQGINTEKESAY